eukprot:Awhi_evm1s12406
MRDTEISGWRQSLPSQYPAEYTRDLRLKTTAYYPDRLENDLPDNEKHLKEKNIKNLYNLIEHHGKYKRKLNMWK